MVTKRNNKFGIALKLFMVTLVALGVLLGALAEQRRLGRLASRQSMSRFADADDVTGLGGINYRTDGGSLRYWQRRIARFSR